MERYYYRNGWRWRVDVAVAVVVAGVEVEVVDMHAVP